MIGELVNGADAWFKERDSKVAIEGRSIESADVGHVSVKSLESEVVVISEVSREFVFAAVTERVVIEQTQGEHRRTRGDSEGGLEGLSARLMGHFNHYAAKVASVFDLGFDLGEAASEFMSVVDNGFSEARSVLSSGAEWDDEIAGSTSVQYNQVKEAVELATNASRAASIDERSADALSNVDSPDLNAGPNKSAALFFDVFGSRESGRSVDFSLRTADGDTVSIKVADLVASRYQMGAMSEESGDFFAALSKSSSYQSGFALQIDGELDGDEVRAINDLLAQISEIGSAFFDGDFQLAFEEALNVGFDSSEIASFSLDLMRVERSQVGVYAEIGKDSVGRDYQPLANMAQRLAGFHSGVASLNGGASEMLQLLDTRLASTDDKAGSASLSAQFRDYVDAVMSRLSS